MFRQMQHSVCSCASPQDALVRALYQLARCWPAASTKHHKPQHSVRQLRSRGNWRLSWCGCGCRFSWSQELNDLHERLHAHFQAQIAEAEALHAAQAQNLREAARP